MDSLEEAAIKLYNTFYSLGLDMVYKKQPHHVKIVEYIENPENDIWWGFKDNVLEIAFYGKNIKSCVDYAIATFTFLSIRYSKDNLLSKHFLKILITLFFVPIGLAVASYYLSLIHISIGLILVAFELAGIFYLGIRIRKWKKTLRKNYYSSLEQQELDIEGQNKWDYNNIPSLYSDKEIFIFIFAWIVIIVTIILILSLTFNF